MADNPRLESNEDVNMSAEENALLSRRDFLVGLKKWSAIVIGGAVLGGALPPQEARAVWVNGGGGAWVNGRGGWVNRGGGSAGWVNRSGGWINGGGGGAGWVNRSGGGGGGAWANSRGGGGGAWVNRRY